MTGSLEHARAEGILAETMVSVSASEALGGTTAERSAVDVSVERVLMSRPQPTVNCGGGCDHVGVSVRVPGLRSGTAC